MIFLNFYYLFIYFFRYYYIVSMEPYGNSIRDTIAQDLSDADITMNIFKSGMQQGCSEMTVRRFCAYHNISRREHVSDAQLEVAINRAINQVGYYGFLQFTEVGNEKLVTLLQVIHLNILGFWINCAFNSSFTSSANFLLE